MLEKKNAWMRDSWTLAGFHWYDISSLVKIFHNTGSIIEHKNIEKRDFIFEIYFN